MIIRLQSDSGTPFYIQIADAIRDDICCGRLKAGQQLPTVRDLASKLRVNPGTVVAAYDVLVHDNILNCRQGSGTFVTEDAARCRRMKKVARVRVEENLPALIELARASGMTLADVEWLVRRSWQGTARTAANQR